MREVIISAALTGGHHGKEANPNLPMTPAEIAQDAFECWQAGAGIAHIHARDKEGKPTADVEMYKDIKERVRQKCDIIISFTTGGGPNLTPEERMMSIYAGPDMCSLNFGPIIRRSLKPGMKSPPLMLRPHLEKWTKTIKDMGIKPELEVYSQSSFVEVINLIEKDLIVPPFFINIVLGMSVSHQGALEANTRNLLSMIDYLPPNSIFNVTALGAQQLPLTTLGILLGGNPRVGMEDNVYYKRGVLAESNAQLVSRSARVIRELQLEVASPEDARQILGLKK